MTTHNDMLRALRGEPQAEEAIFWYCYAWQRGKGSDLYRILTESPYRPNENRKWADDPEIQRLFGELEAHFPQPGETAYMPVPMSEVSDGDILIAGSHFLCLLNRWPCRVFRHEGKLAVACKQGAHVLTADALGYVVGFRR